MMDVVLTGVSICMFLTKELARGKDTANRVVRVSSPFGDPSDQVKVGNKPQSRVTIIPKRYVTSELQ